MPAGESSMIGEVPCFAISRQTKPEVLISPFAKSDARYTWLNTVQAITLYITVWIFSTNVYSGQ
jgi:hypothetical protein